MTGEPGSERLLSIHAEVDEGVKVLERRNAARLQCERGCHDCCVDGITVFEAEAERIRLRHSELLREGAPHPEGRCAFLDPRGACRVYEDRPYVCRTQGLPLRWFAPAQASEPVVEYRDICPLNEVEGAPVEEIPSEDCWLLGPVEEALVRLNEERGGGERVALRSLFHRRDPHEGVAVGADQGQGGEAAGRSADEASRP